MANTNTKPSAEDTRQRVQLIAKAYGNQYVRRDNKFFDLDYPGTPLSKCDVERILLNRIREEHPDVELSVPAVRELFELLIEAKHTDRERSFQVWNGSIACDPGNTNRQIWVRGAMAVNLWKEPGYRQLKVNSAEFDVVGDFFDAFFQNVEEREQFVNWLAWCLQNENDKPAWAPFLYSRNKGTGKSTMCRVVTELFGVDNTAVQNNLNKITQRFNATVLTSKLVISEETKVRPGSDQANTIKTYITDPTILVERKGQETERARQCCCFVFTSNFAPTWIEEGERRYYVIDVNHDGCSGGPKAAQFAELVGRVHRFLDDPSNVGRLYNALMQRELPEDFSAKRLDIARHSTPIMQRLQQTSRHTIVEQLEEALNERGLVVLPEHSVVEFVRKNLSANINQTKHLMDDLEWQKTKVKWGGKDFARAIWVKPGFAVDGGKIYGPDFETVRVADYLEENDPLRDVEIIS